MSRIRWALVVIVVSDFEDATRGTSFGTQWIPSTDQVLGGSSTIELSVREGGAHGTLYSLSMSGEIRGEAPNKFAGAMFFPGDRPMSPVDLSHAAGIRFAVRGTPGTFRVLVFSPARGMAPSIAEFRVSEGWEDIEIDWSAVDPGGGRGVGAIAIVGGPSDGPFQVSIDEVEIR